MSHQNYETNLYQKMKNEASQAVKQEVEAYKMQLTQQYEHQMQLWMQAQTPRTQSPMQWVIHDSQALKTADEILHALDTFAAMVNRLEAKGTQNLIATFNPKPVMGTEQALHARLYHMGILKIVDKDQKHHQYPWGEKGGQKGQQSVKLHFRGPTSPTLTVQIQKRKGNIALKGKRANFTMSAVRLVLPFFGAPVSVTEVGAGAADTDEGSQL